MNIKAFKHHLKFHWREQFEPVALLWTAIAAFVISAAAGAYHGSCIALKTECAPADVGQAVFSIVITLVGIIVVGLFADALFYAIKHRGYEVIDRAFGIRAKRLMRHQYFDPSKQVVDWPLAEDRVTEQIVASAIRQSDGTLFIAMAPGRHHHNIWHIRQYQRTHINHAGDIDDQGFFTDRGRFLSRREAEQLARRTGQIKGDLIGPKLTSEDLWTTPPSVTRAAYLQDKFDRAYK